MPTPEEKLKLVRDQVAFKIRWGATREEVEEWLAQKHNLVGKAAEPLLERAFRLRRAAIRDRAMVRIAIAAAGLIAVAAFVYLRFFSGALFYGTGANIAGGCAVAIALLSLKTLFESIALLVKGETEEPVG